MRDGEALQARVERGCACHAPRRRDQARARSAARAARRAACAPRRASADCGQRADADAVEALQLQARRRRAAATTAGVAFGLRTSAAAIAASCASRPLGCLANSVCASASMPTISPRYGTEVEVGLEDLALLPARARARVAVTGLAELLRRRCGRRSARASRRRSGRRAASSASTRRACACSSVAPGARRRRLPVDAAVLPEALVLAQHDRRAASAGDISASGVHARRARRLVDAQRSGSACRGDRASVRSDGRCAALHLGERRAAAARRRRAPRRRAARDERARSQRSSVTLASRRDLDAPRSAARRSSPARTSPRRASAAARTGPGCCRRTRVLDHVLAARQVLVVAAKRLEAALLVRRPGACRCAARRASRSASRGRGRCRGSSRRPAPGR